MSGPKHQHFIPRSYIKNFAVLEGDTYFVEAKLKDETEPKPKPIAITNICVNKNLYTIPRKDGEDKYALEKFYAENIDGVYPEIYNLLINSEIKEITGDQRVKIIYTVLSLYFRTPHFLRSTERRANAIIDNEVKNRQSANGIIEFRIGDRTFNFDIKEPETARTQLKELLKLDFLTGHLDEWKRFVEHKAGAGIYVLKIKDDIDLIGSDNPIVISKPFHRVTSIFDPENIISFAIDRKHYVQIMPNTVESINQIFRGDRDKWFAIGKNHSIEQHSEDWIYGFPGSITKHIMDQIEHGQENESNLKALEETKEKTFDMMKFVEMLEKYGIDDERVIAFAKELLSKKIHKDDKTLWEIAFKNNQ